MHSIEVGAAGAGTPQFLSKLWKLVEDSKYDNLIAWGPDGTTFTIRNQLQFAKEVLPMYFKHSNMASFVRQLNMYGFRKIANIEQGGLKCENDEIEFQHQYFIKGHELFLPLIKRKIGKAQDNSTINSETMTKMFEDFSALKNKQETLDNQLANLKRENEVVWREVATLRQKHSQQQQIINRMIQFLVSIVRNTNRVPNKRKIPLMFTEPAIKMEKNSFFSLDENNLAEPNSPATGPVIRDVTNSDGAEPTLPIDPQISETVTITTPSETNDDVDEDIEKYDFKLPVKQTTDPMLTEVLNCEPSTSSFEPDSVNLDCSGDESTIAIPTKWNQRADVADHVEGIQNDLDSWLERILSGPSPNLCFDTSALLDIYNTDESFTTTALGEEGLEDKNEITGTELVQYHPNLLELADDEVQLNGVDFSEFDVPVDTILPKHDELVNTPDPLINSLVFTDSTDTKLN